VQEINLKKTYYFISIGILSLAMIFLSACNAVLPAGAKASLSADGKSAQVEFTGTVDSIAANQWVVAGQKLMINSHSIVNGSIVVGNTVKVSATVTADGAVTADKIELPTGSSSFLAMANSLATVDPSATVGPTATVDPLATATPGFSDDKEKEFSGVVETISLNSWQISGQVFIVNGQTVIKGNILVGDKVKVHFLNNSDGTFAATEIGLMDKNQEDVTEKGSSDQEDSSEQDSSNQGDHEDLKLTGKVEAIAPDAWTVNGQLFTVNAETEIKGSILLGDVVKVQYVVNTDGIFTATEIQLAGDNQAHNSNKDNHGNDGEKGGSGHGSDDNHPTPGPGDNHGEDD
jgi:hypothetical protein